MHNHNNKIFIAACLISGANYSMILPLLAPLIRQIHMTELHAGLLVSSGALLMTMSSIWISKRKDWQDIYRLLSVGIIGMAITWGLFAAVLSLGFNIQIPVLLFFGLLLITRASTGFFMAMPAIALQTYVMTSSQNELHRAQQMAKFGALNSAGMILGPILTTLLLTWGILTPLWVAVAVLTCLGSIIVFSYQRDESFKPCLTPTNDPIEHHERLVASVEFPFKKTMIWFVLGFALYLSIVTLNLTAGFYIQDRFHFDIRQSATYFAQCSIIVGISLVIAQVIISKYFKWSIYWLLTMGMIAMISGLVITINTDQILIFQLAYILYGISVACLIPAFTTGAAQAVPLSLQAKVASLCTATQSLGLIVGPLLSTVLYRISIIYPYALLLILFALVSIMFLIANKTATAPVAEAKSSD